MSVVETGKPSLFQGQRGRSDLPTRDSREGADAVFALLREETEGKIEPNLERAHFTRGMRTFPERLFFRPRLTTSLHE